MSRANGKLLAGALTLLAGLGALVLGKKAGEKVAKATEGPPSPPPGPPAEAADGAKPAG